MDEQKKDFDWKYLIPIYGIFKIKKDRSSKTGGLIALNIFLTIILIAMGSGGKKGSHAGSMNDRASQDNSQALNKIGSSVKTRKFDITVNRVTTAKSVGGQFFREQAAEGGIFVIVNAKFKNISDESIGIFSQPRIKLLDPKGKEYDSATAASTAYATSAKLSKKGMSDINPGIAVTDAEVFEVAKSLWNGGAGWQVEVDADDEVIYIIKELPNSKK